MNFQKITTLKYFSVFFLMFLAFGCDFFDSENCPSDMQEVYKEMVLLSESETCSDSEDWLFTAYGSKACGGPIGYIAYSKKIDQNYFLKLVDKFTALQAEYNRKTGAKSDCGFVTGPTRVSCENGKPKFIYS